MGIFNRKKKQEANESSEKQEQNKAVLTLYSVTLDSSIIYDTAKEEFGSVIKSIEGIDNGLEFIFKDETKIQFYLSDEIDYINRQTSGMANFFSKAPLENKEVLEKALLQIRMFTCITGVTFELNEDEQRTNYIINTIYKIADKTQSLILYPSMELYTSDGKLLISMSGHTDFDDYYPIAPADLLKRDVEVSAKDEARYEEIIDECDKKGIPHTSYMLGTQIMEEEVIVPSAMDIAKRAVSVFGCALWAECLLMEGGSMELAKSEFEAMNERYSFAECLSDKEKAYIGDDNPDRIQSIQFSWQYERCAVLLWALGFIELKYPTEICNVREIANLLRNYNSFEELVAASRLRSNEELLDMHTRILYYNWACVEARVNNQQMPAGLDGGVVQEQHFALNWLISANGQCGWDDICPNT
ncbi:DUF4272 domain-containing protein [Clostridium manihotivorum]|uniref:DUF4272 domain-containing protein n=1 Tax=Clostridium manihotivorum TaxID=2320868 RepID=A0A3R5QXM1_9CLOT|nr:DUF4272 domain-containing protein [Clostridium manihotivorum]QAA35053.1 DUF4272 domain-containing protein [Clostridium manihotivorum]